MRCEVCGAEISASGLHRGAEVTCVSCGSVYEAVDPAREYAEEILEQISSRWGVPPPPFEITESLPRGYAGVYLHNGRELIKFHPKWLGPRLIAHEYGHHLWQRAHPEVHESFNPESEEFAKMVEKWWTHGAPE